MTRTHWEKDEWSSIVTQIDGLGRVTRRQTSVPGRPGTFIYPDTHYDGAGRTTRQSRSYLAGTTAEYTEITYDSQSRPIIIKSPSAVTGGNHVTKKFKYGFHDGVATVVESRTDNIQYLITSNGESAAADKIRPRSTIQL